MIFTLLFRILDFSVRVMVFNATFNNISIISWQSVLLVEDTGENHDLPQVTDELYDIMIYYVCDVQWKKVSIGSKKTNDNFGITKYASWKLREVTVNKFFFVILSLFKLYCSITYIILQWDGKEQMVVYVGRRDHQWHQKMVGFYNYKFIYLMCQGVSIFKKVALNWGK